VQRDFGWNPFNLKRNSLRLCFITSLSYESVDNRVKKGERDNMAEKEMGG